MRRIGMIVLSVVMLCAAFGASVAVAQEATPASGGDHPIVGSWLLDTDTANPTNPPTLAVFTSDGVYLQVESGGSAGGGSFVGVGTWQATGASTADMTFWILEGNASTVVIRASLEVADGQSLTGDYTFEIVEEDGTSSGEIGPGLVEGTRLSVEQQGTPVGSFEDVFGEPAATPAG